MKTKTIILICLFLAVGLIQLSAQKASKQDEYTKLGEPAPVHDKMNGKVQKVVAKFYWTKGSGDNIEKGRHITTRERDSLGWYYDFEATFDKIGDHIITYNTLDDNGNPFTSYEFFKDGNHVVKSKWRMGKDTHMGDLRFSIGDGYTTFKYDDHGYEILRADYLTEGNVLLYTYPMKNNEFGDQIEVEARDSKDNLLSKWSTIYNDKRQIIGGGNTDKDGNPVSSYKTIYNEKGKVSDVTYYDKDNKATFLFKYTYPLYDAKGNWLECIVRNNLGQIGYCERTITYY